MGIVGPYLGWKADNVKSVLPNCPSSKHPIWLTKLYSGHHHVFQEQPTPTLAFIWKKENTKFKFCQNKHGAFN